MSRLLDLVSLLLALTSACPGRPGPVTAAENLSPVVNMKLDPRKKLLTWHYRRNVTEQECRIDVPPGSSTRKLPQVQEDGAYFCRFPKAVLHRGATLTVNGTASGQAFRHVLDFQNPGREGSGAANVSCIIYSLRLMRCGWSPGPSAPADVQYHLYGRFDDEEELECPHYVTDSVGTRVGCHFGELTGPQLTDTYSFFVSGTSRDAEVRFWDSPPLRAIQMEKYNAPANITSDHNGSHRIIRWENPQTRFNVSSHLLCYELDLQREGISSQTEPVFQRGSEENVYVLPGSASRAARGVRVRVRFVRGAVWSDWSSTQRFGLPEQDGGGTPVALAGLVMGAAALAGTVLMFLCVRFSLTQKLFPWAPQVDREVTGTLASAQEVCWDGDILPSGLEEPEVILQVEEMQPFGSERAGTEDPASPRSDCERVSCERCPLGV